MSRQRWNYVLTKGIRYYLPGGRNPYVYIVGTGVVRILTGDENGIEKHLMIAGPGSLLGNLSSLDGYPSLFTAATAEENCRLYRTTGPIFTRMTAEIPGFKDFLIQDLCAKMRILAGNISSLSFQTADVRIVRAFLYLIRESGTRCGRGIKINIPFTHQEMADLVYSNRVTVSRFFSRLKYLHMFNPCLTGWGIKADTSIEVSRLAVESNFFPLYEVENGSFTINKTFKEPKPVKEYLGRMKKFKHLNEEEAEEIQELVDYKWNRLTKLAGL
ncbi:helix-turn-helix domain-containing protein [Extibacter muris]|nr:helix-turn-helix domain-containing protein [Extibacter muris]MCU0080235.1 helix-turn-helix domain-containing protein [Extibacter muris]